MSGEELLLLHGNNTGGQNMAGRCTRFQRVWSPLTGGYVKRCAKRSSFGSLGEIGEIGELGETTSLRATLGDAKQVLITGSIAAGGAIITDKIFSMIEKRYPGLSGNKALIAQLVLGLGVGIVVGKFLKKPKLGANLAIGPVVLVASRVLGQVLGARPLSTSGLGMMAIEPYRETLSDYNHPMALGSTMQVGPGVPSWMMQPEGFDGALAGM